MSYDHDLRPDRELKIECRLDSETDHELHRHDLLEINVLLENKARFRLLDLDYTGEPGDVFLFRPYEPHYNLAAAEGAPIRWIMLLFSPSIARLIPQGDRLLYPFYTSRTTPLIKAGSEHAKRIQAAAAAALAEQEQGLPGWEAKRFMHFVDILVSAYRHSLEAAEESTPDEEIKVETGVVSAVEYMIRNVTEDIDMRQLIDGYERGKTYFYTDFKRTVGVTPNQFIHRMRMQIAMHLLQTTGKTVTDIAFECGYHSVHYFNKHFKQYRSVSPREYRSRYQRPV
ncbi:AraC family transcriptional regulator [Paenibacillus luteus]|uniref:AraC family transcriptional regulator n=1 Tax=Paenibacillus luteus TaxID=2545753 RepID=UPI001142846C|nr:AraC family transcriptional regulator [Paenibacillus luteus]